MWKTLRTKAICRHSSGEIFGKARGTSSNGRALDSHSRGTGIDTPVLQLCFFEITTIRIVGLLILVEIDSLEVRHTGIDLVAKLTHITGRNERWIYWQYATHLKTQQGVRGTSSNGRALA